jgi:hypothetical protein
MIERIRFEDTSSVSELFGTVGLRSGDRDERERDAHRCLGFRRAGVAGMVVPGIADLLGKREDADEEQGDEASTVAQFTGRRWAEARAIVRRRS